MTDLDETIRAYADEWHAEQRLPPDLDAALGRATRTGRRSRTVPILAAASVVVAASLVVAMVSAGDGSGHGQAVKSPTPTGTVIGRLLEVGGPVGARSNGVPGTIYAFTKPDGSGPPVATATANRLGAFSVSLRPGAYYLRATSPDYVIDPKPSVPPCSAEGKVTVTVARIVRADVYCQLK